MPDRPDRPTPPASGTPYGTLPTPVDVVEIAEVLLDNIELLAIARGDALGFVDSCGRRLTIRLATTDELLDLVNRAGDEIEAQGGVRPDGLTRAQAETRTRRLPQR